MTVLCAWCKRHLSGAGEPVSHGICPSCLEANLPCDESPVVAAETQPPATRWDFDGRLIGVQENGSTLDAGAHGLVLQRDPVTSCGRARHSWPAGLGDGTTPEKRYGAIPVPRPRAESARHEDAPERASASGA